MLGAKAADAICLVIDATKQQFDLEQKIVTGICATHPYLSCLPLLCFSNKSDKDDAKSVAAVCENVHLHTLRNREWYITTTESTTGNGVIEGFQWLHIKLKQLQEIRKEKALRSKNYVDYDLFCCYDEKMFTMRPKFCTILIITQL